MIRSFPLVFETDYNKGVRFHRHLQDKHPELASETSTSLDYVKKYYELFRHNDLALLQREILICPINYGYTWHLVAVDKPKNALEEGKDSNVYFLSSHPVVPQYSMAQTFTKYLTMAFHTMGYKAIPENFKYQELILEECTSQSQVMVCVYTELVYLISKNKKDMSTFFSGIKPEVQRLKFEHYIFARYVQTLLNCFAVEVVVILLELKNHVFLLQYNEHGQIPKYGILVLENEDLSWVEETDIDRILNPDRQMRVVRPIRRIGTKRPPVSEWPNYRGNLTNHRSHRENIENNNPNANANANGDTNADANAIPNGDQNADGTGPSTSSQN
ncbi:hypothetical protein CAEBREN_03526 [Caenorhabditis brenneri]|uniref:Uncharacterized protein n=1 Tax=Caenorhabditis brenneri TaxID=135651 RepID=G0M7A1_CAEBE|nr:hypothetical protein CAEBREN_03526 [Caenorhabditis brenneri]